MPIELVVFDMAGTTIEDNNNVAQALQYAMQQAGYEVTLEAANQVMGYPKPVAISWLLEQQTGAPVATDSEEVEAIHRSFVDEMIRFYKEHDSLSGKQGVLETFSTLRGQGIKVALDTGFSRDIADAIFNRLGWKPQEHFDVSITSDEVDNGRPHPDMIFRAMQLTGVQHADAVAKVGDTASDMQQGQAAGCRYVIGVTSGAYSREDLLQEPHTHLIHQINEVIRIVA